MPCAAESPPHSTLTECLDSVSLLSSVALLWPWAWTPQSNLFTRHSSLWQSTFKLSFYNKNSHFWLYEPCDLDPEDSKLAFFTWHLSLWCTDHQVKLRYKRFSSSKHIIQTKINLKKINICDDLDLKHSNPIFWPMMIYHQTSSEDIVKTYLDYITLLWRPQPNLFTWHSTPQWMNDAPPHQIWLQKVAQFISSGPSQTHGLTDRMIPHPTTPKNNINKRHFIMLEGIVVTKFVFRSHKSSNQHRSAEP